MLDGKILAFGDLGEAEIGHIVVEPDGPECCCGNRGCVEALCSGPGLTKLCGLLAERHPQQWTSSRLSSGAEKGPVRSERIVQVWEHGDRFRSKGRGTFHGTAGIRTGGNNQSARAGAHRGGGRFRHFQYAALGLLRDRVKPLVVPYFRDSYTIVRSHLRESVVTQGAAILASQRANLARFDGSTDVDPETPAPHQRTHSKS